jgi:TRAP-type C4-dicarboxylate transport system permease small subunit
VLKLLRRLLDGMYKLGGAIASLFLIAILLIIVAQMVARWTGNVFPGATSYAGYCMASASFFALAYALNRGSHIRVTLLLGALGRWRFWGEIWSIAIAAITATLFARFAIKANIWSHKFNDISQGQDATPLWIPQLAMSIGTIVLAIALWDHLIRLVTTGKTGIHDSKIKEIGGDVPSNS